MSYMEKMNLFNHEEFIKNTYVVTENYAVDRRFTIGVVVGAERVLVIDSGFGMAGDLRKYIEGFVGTEKPIFCICTHGHSDVLGAASQFDEVYLKKEDAGAFPESTDPALRLQQLAGFVSGDAQMLEYGKKVMLDNSKVSFRDLKDGDHFHLGGVHVGIIEIPGHTKGSIAVRITREGVTKSAFCGDAFSAGMNHLLNMNRRDLLIYSERLEQFMMKLEDQEPIYCTHSSVPMTKRAGMAVAKACYEVAEGMTAGDPAFQGKEDLRIHFTDNYCIVYNRKLAES